MEGFKPIFDSQSEILILGTFPSVKSREANFYYAHTRNRFWKMLERIFDVQLEDTQSKKEFLLKYRIALWDIIDTCENKNSSDNNFKNVKLNDLSSLLPPLSKVTKILCNGAKCYELTMKKEYKIPVLKMPSTSPANVYFDENIWQEELSVLISHRT